jgi:hypothetical protein
MLRDYKLLDKLLITKFQYTSSIKILITFYPIRLKHQVGVKIMSQETKTTRKLRKVTFNQHTALITIPKAWISSEYVWIEKSGDTITVKLVQIR